jgi:hypothetical protein
MPLRHFTVMLAVSGVALCVVCVKLANIAFTAET